MVDIAPGVSHRLRSRFVVLSDVALWCLCLRWDRRARRARSIVALGIIIFADWCLLRYSINFQRTQMSRVMLEEASKCSEDHV